MAPIRVGFIGLTTKTNPMEVGAWGVISHLTPLRVMPDKYQIVAVANSSVESAQRSIDAHKLEAKAYGNPTDLANDPDVEMVVVSVNVGKHVELATPALQQKKTVFVEWPLGAGLAESEKLAELAATQGVKTVVGVQGQTDPAVTKAREIVASGQLGKILSSTVAISTGILPADVWFEGAEYYISWKTGGNEFFIMFAHFLHTFTYVLGDFESVNGILKGNTSEVPILNQKFEIVKPSHPKDTPDQIFVQGVLESGAVASIAHRKPFKGAVDGIGYRWIITGTEGEMEITQPEGQWQFGPEQKVMKLKVGKDGQMQTVDFMPKGDIFEGAVKPPGTNTGRTYEAFAMGEEDKFATFESALKTHRLLDRIVKSAGWEAF